MCNREIKCKPISQSRSRGNITKKADPASPFDLSELSAEEISKLRSFLKTIQMVPRSKEVRPVGYGWVFNLKYNTDDTL